jgi:general secretion pathway protein G
VNCKKPAFTLVEILIVVTILAILAAIVVPHFTSAAEESKLSNLMTNLQLIRTQLEMYRMEHEETFFGNRYPTNINAQLTGKTDADGTLNASGAYGPYMHIFPANPFLDDPAMAVKTRGKPGEGWSYSGMTGVIVPNTAGHGGL